MTTSAPPADRFTEPLAAEWRDVWKSYRSWLPWRPAVPALRGASLALATGEVFGLVGPNRAGKTTLVKVLLGLARCDRGAVRRLGRGLDDRRTLARVGYVHERPAFPPYLTARELLDYYGALGGLPGPLRRQRTGELLERLGLADRSREPIGGFSKGMWQRLSLAQALLSDPELLVLDEPAEGLDLVARRLMCQLVAQRRAAGRTVLLVSHSLAEVESLCDRVGVMRDGRLAFVGTLQELTQSRRPPGEQPASLEAALGAYYEESEEELCCPTV